MNWSVLVTALGMAVNVLGSVLLYIGSPLDSTGAGRLTSAEIELREGKALQRRRSKSRQGFVCLVIGFVLQFTGFFLPRSAVHVSIPAPTMAVVLVLATIGAGGALFLVAALIYRQFWTRPRLRASFSGETGVVLRLNATQATEGILNVTVFGPDVEVEWAAVATVDPAVSIAPARNLATPPYLTWNRIDQPATVLRWAPSSFGAQVLASRQSLCVNSHDSLAIPFKLEFPNSPLSVKLVVAIKCRVQTDKGPWLGGLFMPPWKIWQQDGIIVERLDIP